MHTRSILIGAAFLFAGFVVRAQMQSQQLDSVQQRRELEQNANLMVVSNTLPELYAGESGDVGPQSVLQIKPHRKLFEASADVQYFFTDNMFLASGGKREADVLASTVSAALAPSPFEFHDGLLAPRLGYQHQWFAYDLAGSRSVAINNPINGYRFVGLETFDFNASTIFSDVTWQRHNWQFTVGGDFRRLLDTSSSAEFYREIVPRWEARRDFLLSDRQMISLAYEGDYRVTDTANVTAPDGSNFYDRTDHSLLIVGSWQLCQHAMLQPSIRLQYTHYTATSRDDLLQTLGLAIYCPLTQQITLRAYLSYDSLNTEGNRAKNYQKLDVGGGLNLTVRF